MEAFGLLCVVVETPAVRLIEGEESEAEAQQSTADMFKDMLTQKKNMLLSKLTSFDSDVSLPCDYSHAYSPNQAYSYSHEYA